MPSITFSVVDETPSLLEKIHASNSDYMVFIGVGHSLSDDAPAVIQRHIKEKDKISVWCSTKVTASDHVDECVIDVPHFSPERLLSDNYLRAGFVAKRSDVIACLDLIENESPLTLYQLALVLTHTNPLVGHIQTPIFIDNGITESIQKIVLNTEDDVIRNELNRRGVDADVENTPLGSRRIKRHIFQNPLVSIIIPTGLRKRSIKNRETLLIEQCVQSIVQESSYPNFEIIVVEDENTLTVASPISWRQIEQVRIVPYNKEFNFADKCNVGFLQSNGRFVIFLNDDTEVISQDWIETLIGHLQDVGVGMSGPTLFLENGLIQSASICNKPAPHNYGAGMTMEQFSANPQNRVAREVSGVTGACIALRREVYEEVGGMSIDFPNNFNDIDLCFKLLYKSYRIIWTPHAQLCHYEAQSRDPFVEKSESEALRLRWGRYFGKDRFTPH